MSIRYLFSEKLPAVPRERFAAAAALGFAPLVTVHQEHGSHVVVLDADYVYPGLEGLIANQPVGDALVTNQSGLYIGVKTADCVPLLLWDEEAELVAAVHAGWRGTAKGIVREALGAMCALGAKPARVTAAIGPCVCGRCYETGAEVPESMPPEAAPFILPKSGGKYLVDLPAINSALLQTLGVGHILPPPACTACNPERYWSHRRHGTERGLQLSMIGMCR